MVRTGIDTLEKKRKYGHKIREDKSALRIPKCPFCSETFKRPEDIRTEFTDVLGGKCDCGAVYLCDVTGKTLGETFMDALVYACEGDWDRAMTLVPGMDYDEATLNYDAANHSVPTSSRTFTRGKVIFIKIK